MLFPNNISKKGEKTMLMDKKQAEAAKDAARSALETGEIKKKLEKISIPPGFGLRIKIEAWKDESGFDSIFDISLVEINPGKY